MRRYDHIVNASSQSRFSSGYEFHFAHVDFSTIYCTVANEKYRLLMKRPCIVHTHNNYELLYHYSSLIICREFSQTANFSKQHSRTVQPVYSPLSRIPPIFSSDPTHYFESSISRPFSW